MLLIRIISVNILLFFTYQSSAGNNNYWIKQGDKAIGDQNIEHAVFCYTQAINDKNSNVLALLKRAKAHQLNGDFVKSAYDKKRAYEIDPAFVKQFLQQGKISIRE